MKKLKINGLKDKLEALTREELKFVMGGDGDDGDCAERGSPCSPPVINCCNLLHCVVVEGENKCLKATL